jgi:hypothetical protein
VHWLVSTRKLLVAVTAAGLSKQLGSANAPQAEGPQLLRAPQQQGDKATAAVKQQLQLPCCGTRPSIRYHLWSPCYPLPHLLQWLRRMAPPSDPYLHNDLHLREAPEGWPGEGWRGSGVCEGGAVAERSSNRRQAGRYRQQACAMHGTCRPQGSICV